MEHTLHILKNSEASEALELISSSEKGDDGVQVLLIQEAVGLRPALKGPVYVLEEDLKARNATSEFQPVSYSKMLDLILGADSVFLW